MSLSPSDNVRVFNDNAREYDDWFDQYPAVFQSELAALRELMPGRGKGLEIGAGTGRFAKELGVKIGVEPAAEMGALARQRGLEIHQAFAEKMPFPDASFDFALMVTVLCFVKDPAAALSEVKRILKPGGLLLLGFIDKESRTGQKIQSSGSKFYRDTFLFSARDMMELLNRSGFQRKDSRQTLFGDTSAMTLPDRPEPGFGKGDFVVMAAVKT